MKKFLKIIGVLVLIVVLVAVGAMVYVTNALPNIAVRPDVKVEVTPERVDGVRAAAAVARAGLDAMAQALRPGSRARILRGHCAATFADLVDAYVNQQAGVTLDDVNSGLIALLNAADLSGIEAPLSTLLGNLHARNRPNSRVLDALLLIDDLLAERMN